VRSNAASSARDRKDNLVEVRLPGLTKVGPVRVDGEQILESRDEKVKEKISVIDF
jgi:hypothetical protein